MNPNHEKVVAPIRIAPDNDSIKIQRPRASGVYELSRASEAAKVSINRVVMVICKMRI